MTVWLNSEEFERPGRLPHLLRALLGAAPGSPVLSRPFQRLERPGYPVAGSEVLPANSWGPTSDPLSSSKIPCPIVAFEPVLAPGPSLFHLALAPLYFPTMFPFVRVDSVLILSLFPPVVHVMPLFPRSSSSASIIRDFLAYVSIYMCFRMPRPSLHPPMRFPMFFFIMRFPFYGDYCHLNH